MNEHFHFKRWGLLVQKHWRENRKKYLLSLGAIAGLLIIWFSIMMLAEQHNPYSEEWQVSTFYVGLALTGWLFASLFFGEMAGGPKAMHYLSVPASALEKLLCAVLFATVLFTVCYVAIFYLVDMTMVQVANKVLPGWAAEKNVIYQEQAVVNVFRAPVNEDGNYYYWLFIAFIHTQAAFLLGSINFPAYSFVKTTVSVLLVFLFFVLYVSQVLINLLPEGTYVSPDFTAYSLRSYDYRKGIKLADWIGDTITFLFQYGWAPLLWSVTYFRLKEKEV
jgi:hypothetical protein